MMTNTNDAPLQARRSVFFFPSSSHHQYHHQYQLSSLSSSRNDSSLHFIPTPDQGKKMGIRMMRRKDIRWKSRFRSLIKVTFQSSTCWATNLNYIYIYIYPPLSSIAPHRHDDGVHSHSFSHYSLFSVPRPLD